MDRRQFIQTLGMAVTGLASGGLAHSRDTSQRTIGLIDVRAWGARQKKVSVSYEWAPLREVVVGYPFIKLSNRFPSAVNRWLEVPPEF
jgi:hypothetical protein